MMSTNEILGLKSIKEYQKKGIGGLFKEHLSLGWTFDKPYEKLILVTLVLLGFWKIIGFF